MATHALTKGSFANVCHLSSCDKIRIIDLSYYIGISRFLTFLFSFAEKVGVKVIDKTKLDDKTTKMLLREIKVMDACNHPNLVRLYEVLENKEKLEYKCIGIRQPFRTQNLLKLRFFLSLFV